MKEIILSTLLICMHICVIGLILSIIPSTYYYIFQHKEWKAWKYFIKNADKFQIEYIISGNEIYVWEQYKAVIWENGLCSIHTENGECIVCTFNKNLSKQMAVKLKEVVFKNK